MKNLKNIHHQYDSNRQVTIGTKITASHKRALCRLAKLKGISFSDLIREYIPSEKAIMNQLVENTLKNATINLEWFVHLNTYGHPPFDFTELSIILYKLIQAKQKI